MPVPVYKFSFVNFQIFDTRARSHDTDYASFGVAVGKVPPVVKTQFMGQELGNGIYPTTLVFDNLPVGSYQTVFVHNLVVNQSHGTQESVGQDLVNAATSLLETAAKVAVEEVASDLILALADVTITAISTGIGAALGTLIPVPLLGSAVGALVGWFVGKIGGLINADCDGIVATELAILQGGKLWLDTAAGEYRTVTNHVVTSPDGCNTSNYTVTWTIQRVVRTVVSTLLDNTGVMHLFAVGKDGRVYTQYSTPGAAWFSGGWLGVGNGTFSQGTPVTSLLDNSGVMHLFAVGENGAIFTQQSKPFTNWSPGWTQISTTNFTQCTAISALVDKAGLIHLFAIGKDGHVYTQASVGTTFSSGGWLPVSSGTFSQGTEVSVLLDQSGAMHLFAVGEDGKVYTIFTNSTAPLKFPTTNWSSVSTGVFAQGTTVSTLLGNDGVMHLFAVGEDGHVYTQWAKPSAAWNAPNWVTVSNISTFSPGTPVTSLLDKSGAMHLFAVGQDGHVYTKASTSTGTWSEGGWGQVSTGVFYQGTTATPLLDNAGEMHLFAVGEDGHVYTQWAQPSAAWSATGWATVSTGVFS